MSGERVTIERHKWPDVPHYEYDAVHLGDDEHGSWFASPAGNPIRRGGVVLFEAEQPSLYLVPIDRPWMVWFGANAAFGFDVYVDVGTVPVRTPGRVTMVDLDLDVVRNLDGTVEVLDEDELVEHAVTYGYPPELVTHAERTAAEVVALVEAGAEPFGRASHAWLALAPRRLSSGRLLRTDRASRVISAPVDRVYAALVDERDLVAWLPPAGMTARFERFDPRPGGSYRLVLTYEEGTDQGKATADSDVVDARFVDLEPGVRVVQEVDFESDDPSFAGTMTMTWALSAVDGGTLVEIVADDVPDGISAHDHAVGMASSLDNLARHLER